MGEREAETLARARENFVRKRREMAEQMIPSGAAAGHFAPSFTELQEVIEALDRAIADERGLRDGYAELRLPVDDGDNVERVNFELK